MVYIPIDYKKHRPFKGLFGIGSYLESVFAPSTKDIIAKRILIYLYKSNLLNVEP